LSQTTSSKTYKYIHPLVVNESNYYNEIHLNIIDTGNNSNVVYNYPMHIYRSPVLMIHGLWSNFSNTFNSLKYELLSNFYPSKLIPEKGYHMTNDQSFQENQYVVDGAVSSSILNIVEDKFSAGKVNIVAHSMGGILSRIYLQSDDYRNDICRLITLNTPHSGSQMANFLLDPLIPVLPELLQSFLFLTGNNPYQGAVDDLKVDSDATRNFLNGNTTLNNNIAPSHVISSTALFSDLVGWESVILNLIINAFPGLVIDALFNFRPNDNVVADLSQEGGLLNKTQYSNLSHSGTPSNSGVMNEVINLLNEDPNDLTYFSDIGFDPPILNYIYPFSGINKNYVITGINEKLDGSVSITSPQIGSHFEVGSEITVTVNGTGDIDKILFAAGNSSIEPYLDMQTSQQGVFNYTIPIESVGRINLLAVGYSDSGYVDSDTIYIYADVNAVLDSIESFAKNVNLFVGRTNSIFVKGYYSDGIDRDLSFNPDVSYSVINENVANFIEPGLINGIAEDTTTALVAFQGHYTTSNISVLPDDIFTGIEEESESNINNIVESFYLYQNYPNPFNPITKIKYSVPQSSNVVIKVFDVLGNEIETLVNEQKPTGNYEVEFNAAKLPSGIYFYRLQAGSFVETKKMVLMK